MNRQLRILLLSSQPPARSANLARDMIAALEESGHEVDFLTALPFEGMDDRHGSVYGERDLRRLGWKKFLRRMAHAWEKLTSRNRSGITIVNLHEDRPPVAAERVAERIGSRYDLVLTLFWQDMITARTLDAVYRKLRCPILIHAVDMFPITGGCYYFRQCTRYTEGCGCCPALRSTNPKDATRCNYLYKKKVYDEIECAYLGNSWMIGHVERTDLFSRSLVRKSLMLINEKTFAERDAAEARSRLGIGSGKRFVLFAGAQRITEKRKGFDYLVEAIDRFTASLTEVQRAETVLILAGRNKEKIDLQSLFRIELREVGMLDTEHLALAYAASTVFLSPSIDDAGPSMVNQSLMCGTPVVAFATGVALDLVEEGVSGYRARYRDAEDFARGLRTIYDLSGEEYRQLRASCREKALAECSFGAFAKNIERIYAEFRPEE